MKYFLVFFLFFYAILISATAQTYQQWISKSAYFMEQNHPDSAEYALKSAMKTDPANKNNSSLLMSLGVIQRQMKHYNEALLSFSAALNGYPDTKVVLHNRAALFCDMGNYAEAMNDYNEIIRLYPDNVQAYYRRGLLFLEAKDRSRAESDFEKAWQLDPENLYSLLSKALIYKLDDNWTDAEKIYTKIIDKAENPSSIIYLNRAECYVNSDQTFKASADLRAAEPGERQNPYFYFLRARVRLKQYDKMAARSDFQKAKELGYDPIISAEWIKKAK